MSEAPDFFAKSIAENSLDALIAISIEGKILFWNSGAEAIFGYAREEALGQSLIDLVVPRDRIEEAHRAVQQAIETGSMVYESVRRRKDGSLAYVDISKKAVRDEQGRVQFISVSKKDVTMLKVLRDAKVMESRFRGLLDSTPDAIVIVNHTGRIVLINKQGETLFRYSREELVGQPVEILLPNRYRGKHVGYRTEYFSEPRTRSMGAGLELHGIRKDGVEFPVEISLSPLETDAGVFAMSAVRDISDRKRIEQALREKSAEMERANLAKDRFLASMSHELRTPLNAIIGFTGTLLMKLPGPLTGDQQKQLQTIQNSGRHLLSLINDLLDLAKIESGKVEVKLEPVLCQEVINEITGTLRPLAQHKGLALNLLLPGKDVVCRTDRRAFSQILINLVNNAIKFTEKGGITISLSASGSNGAASTIVSITDTGIGIMPEDQAKLFQAFVQLDSSSTRRHEGTGLGLHLSQKLAELIGGKISFQSEVNKGSTFTLSIENK